MSENAKNSDDVVRIQLNESIKCFGLSVNSVYFQL